MPNAQMLTTECFLIERQTRRSSCHASLLKDKPVGDEKTRLGSSRRKSKALEGPHDLQQQLGYRRCAGLSSVP